MPNNKLQSAKIRPQPVTDPSAVRPLPRAKPKKKAQEVNINIQRATEQRLIDHKLFRDTRSSSENFFKFILGALLAGVLVGGGLVVYLLVSRTPATPQPVSSIIIPEEETSEKIPPPAETEAATSAGAAAVITQKVEILPTPTGFLNVRSGPSTKFEKLTQVKPGETYDLVSQDLEKGWYEIKLSSSQTGWVTKQYAKIKE